MQLWQGDCLELMDLIPDGTIDLVVTDPPYGMSFQSSWCKNGPRYKAITGDDKVDPRWIYAVKDKLKIDGGVITFCDWKTSYQWKTHLEDAGFKVRSQIIWDRVAHGMGDLKGQFAPMHDIIWYATLGRRAFRGKRPKSVLRFQRPMATQDYGHPTCKPVELMEALLEPTAKGTVIDPFLGSGSTGVACAKLGIDFIGIEIDPEYYETAVRRIFDAII